MMSVGSGNMHARPWDGKIKPIKNFYANISWID